MAFNIDQVLETLGVDQKNAGTSTGKNWIRSSSNYISSISPVNGKVIAEVQETTPQDYEAVILKAQEAFEIWKNMPAPKRGEIVRQFGDRLREVKEPLGQLVSYEMGKSLQEGLGEVQEMIDICDFATGLSRQLYGLTMHSERAQHRMYEQYHPLGIVGIISAFNFPVAVWSWNSTIAWVCGNVCLWKPSEKTPITAVACQNIIARVLEQNKLPEGISNLVIGDYQTGQLMTEDTRIPLISATGSTRMGKVVGSTVAQRMGKTILELGGNNAIIITEHADLDVALRAAVFGAVGTAGQRCTSTRRLIIHENIYEAFKARLVAAYEQLSIGDPLDEQNHVGPLIDRDAVKIYEAALTQIESSGGKPLVAGEVLSGSSFESGCYVKPAVYEVEGMLDIVKTETFAPILYLLTYDTIEDAIAIQNDAPQGLSSAIMTTNLQEAELFLSASGSDCGIANVNIGTSGAEIGGAFGGEKETGGGRESGSDSWKAYMRRQTNTINYGKELPLAQGIKFDL
jgi:aldehyde dehydrogenase (NAD+)